MTHFSLQLRSENPPFGSDFHLAPGGQVRIGASPKADISIPFPGVADVSLIIGRSGNGLLYVSQPDGSAVRYIEPPAIVAVAPYHFIVTESASRAIPASSQPTPGRRRGAKKQSPWVIIAGSIAALLFFGFVFAELRRPTKPPITKSATPVSPAQQPPVAVVEKREEPTVPIAVSEAAKPVSPAPIPEPAVPIAKILDFEELADKASAAVYTVQTKDEEGNGIASGTAFAISADGLAVTNFHVIRDAKSINVQTAKKKRISVARVVAVNPKADLALLSVTEGNDEFLELGDSQEIKIGASIAVYGAPKGFSGTFSTGIISAKRPISDLASVSKFDPNLELIQITAPISPGSSGSPVMDRHGKVIGVATLTWTEELSQSLNFAVPSAAVQKLREDAAKGLAGVAPPNPRPPDPPKPKFDLKIASPILDDEILAEYDRYVEKKDYDNALSASIRLVTKYPEASLSHTMYGSSLLRLDLPEQAEKAFEKALGINGTDHGTWYLLGLAQMDLEKYIEARRSFRRVVELDPTYTDAWEDIAALSIAFEEVPEAIASLEKLRALNYPKYQEWLTWHSNQKDPSPGLKTLLKHFGVRSSGENSTQGDFHNIVTRLIENYLSSQEQGSALTELSHFSEVVNPYYEKGRRSKAEILPHIEAFRKQWPERKFEFIRLEQADFLNRFNLEVTYVVRFTTSNGRDQRSGQMRQTLHLTEDANKQWRISAIKTHTN